MASTIRKGLPGMLRLVVQMSSRLLGVNLPRERPQRRWRWPPIAVSINALVKKKSKLRARIPEEPEILVKRPPWLYPVPIRPSTAIVADPEAHFPSINSLSMVGNVLSYSREQAIH